MNGGLTQTATNTILSQTKHIKFEVVGIIIADMSRNSSDFEKTFGQVFCQKLIL